MKDLYADLYEPRMAASYRPRRMIGSATFSLFVRRMPARRGFLVAAGLANVLDFLETGIRLDPGDLGRLAFRARTMLDEAELPEHDHRRSNALVRDLATPPRFGHHPSACRRHRC